MSETVVIVGAGQAAGQLAASLRSDGYSGKIVLLGEEPHALISARRCRNTCWPVT